MRFSPNRFQPIALAILIALSLACSTASAQPARSDNPYLGYWKIEEPAGDSCFIVIKSHGQASTFWSGAIDHIESGEWTRREDSLLITWDTGYTDVLRRNEDETVTRETFPPGRSVHQEPLLVARGEKLERDVIGSLTTSPSDSAREAPTQQEPPHHQPEPGELRNRFVGYWEIEQGGTDFMGLRGVRDRFFLRIARDGTTAATQRNWSDEYRNQTGRWQVNEDELRIRWPSGHVDALRPTEDGSFAMLSWTPRQDESGRHDRKVAARMVSAAQVRGLFHAGHTTQVSIEDFIGPWTEEHVAPGANRPHLKIERWGNAYRYIDPEKPALGRIPGEWKMGRDGIVVTWQDGVRDVIEVTQRGTFVQATFSVGTPVTGTPEERRPVRRITRQEQATTEAQAMARERAAAESRRR